MWEQSFTGACTAEYSRPSRVLPPTAMLSRLVSSGFDCAPCISGDQLLLANQNDVDCGDLVLSLFFLYCRKLAGHTLLVVAKA